MTNMEDNGIVRALHRLAKIGKVDFNRVLFLRSGSNYSAQPPGETAAWSLTAPYPAKGITAKESCYRVARPVVHALIDGWDDYQETIPSVSDRVMTHQLSVYGTAPALPRPGFPASYQLLAPPDRQSW